MSKNSKPVKLTSSQLRSVVNSVVTEAKLSIARKPPKPKKMDEAEPVHYDPTAASGSGVCPDCGYDHKKQPREARDAHELGDPYVSKKPGLREANERVGEVAALALASCMVEILAENQQLIADNAYERWMGSEGVSGDLRVPVRFEDVSAFADAVVDVVLQDEDLRRWVAGRLKLMLESSMDVD